jgi:FkbM family methyltransferase
MNHVPDINRSADTGVGKFDTAYIPHVGWLRHEPGEEVISLLRQGCFEAPEQAFYWLYLRPGDTFIDCGAHIGLYSIIADRATAGATRVIAVEPSGATADHLEFNLKQNGVKDAQIIRAAIWTAAGHIQFIYEGDGKAAYDHVAFDEGVVGASVSTITLDQIVKDAGAKEVALVKIDVEGAEPEALTGAQHAIERGMLSVLMVEFTEHNLGRRGLSTQNLIVQLKKLGYTLCEFSQELLELVTFSSESPIWFKNLFACRDLEQVNARLRSASEGNRAIARDILGRALACNRFKDLEELDRYRNIASEVDKFRQWAERTEKMLAAEKEISAQLRTWAENAEARIKQAQQAVEDNRAWAEHTEQMLAGEKEISAQLRTWVDNLNKDLQGTGQQLKEKCEELCNIEEDLKKKCCEVDNKEKEIEAIKSSLSWRLTAPIRLLLDRLNFLAK